MSSVSHKNILIILYYYHPYVSGLSLLAKMQAEGLVARGHHVTVLATQHDANLASAEIINGVKVVRSKVLAKVGKGVVSFDLLRKIVRLSKTHDVINPHLPMAHFGLILPFIDTDKLVPQYHCDLNLGPGVITRRIQCLSYWSMRKVLQKSKKIIVTTKDYFVHSVFSSYANRACEIYPPIDQNRFHQVNSGYLKERFSIEGRHKVIGFVGRIVAEKGLDYLLGAIPYLENELDDFLILIAGDYESVAGGSVKAQIDKLVEKNPEHVKFVGHLKFDDLVAFYSMIDVLVLPSIDPLEAFGMVQVEAMLCGTPVVASDMPGVREVVRKTGFGRLVKIKDSQDIADKVAELLMNPITINPEKLVDFNFEHAIDKYEEAFSDVLASRPC